MERHTIEESTARPLTSVIRSSPVVVRNSRFFGLVNHTESWRLSWKGRLVIGLLIIGLAASLMHGVYPFLAVTRRVDTDALVVEGWVHQYAIHAAINEFHAGHYERIFTTGGPVEGSGGYINDYNTSASLAAGRLKAEGLSPELIQMVPSRVMDRDRTYGSAVALRNWFREHDIHIRSLNVLTENVHARRTRLLFSEALGPGMSVGIIAAPHPDYDPRHWWRYSEGVRDVVSEGVAYLYAKLFFWPSGADFQPLMHTNKH